MLSLQISNLFGSMSYVILYIKTVEFLYLHFHHLFFLLENICHTALIQRPCQKLKYCKSTTQQQAYIKYTPSGVYLDQMRCHIAVHLLLFFSLTGGVYENSHSGRFRKDQKNNRCPASTDYRSQALSSR